MLVLALIIIFVLASCSSKPIVQTQVLERPVPIYCRVETPPECKDAYAVDRVSTQDNPVTINRAFREEIEERWRCEIKLLAALRGCNTTQLGK